MMYRVALAVLLVGLGLTAPRAYLPFVANGAAVKPTITTLVADDTTNVTAYVLPSTARVIVTYIDRAHGNLLHVAEDTGAGLVDLPLPPGFVTPAAVQPAFLFPGPKQANGATVATNGILHIYACTRDVGDTNGPFKLKRLDIPLP